MHLVVLDGNTANPGDLSWAPMQKLGSLTVYPRTSPAELMARIADAEVVFTNKVVLSAETIRACPKLRFIGVMATGYNVVDLAAARERGIPVCNVPAYSTNSVAQLVFAFLLEIAHHTAHHSEAVAQGRWSSCPDFCFWDTPLLELDGMTLGIVGCGSIGRRVAAIAQSFGMRVLGHNRTPRPELQAAGITLVSQEELFASAQVVSLHCPQNPESENLICDRTLALMSPETILINTARGACVVEADVARALREDRLGWYAADVLSSEPPAADNPLLNAPRTLLTPHMAWATRQARQRLMDTLTDNLRAFLDGAPIHVVNGLSGG